MSFWEPPFSPPHTLSVLKQSSAGSSAVMSAEPYVSQRQAQSLLYSYHFLTS